MTDETLNESVLFYAAKTNEVAHKGSALSEEMHFEVWEPSFRSLAPKGELDFKQRTAVRLLSVLQLLGSPVKLRVFRIYRILSGSTELHFSFVLSRNWRFPFMGGRDIQIGPVWTNPKVRGRGLQRATLERIIRDLASETDRFWWICHSTNVVSRTVIERAGFRLVGRGHVKRVMHLRFLKQFVIAELLC